MKPGFIARPSRSSRILSRQESSRSQRVWTSKQGVRGGAPSHAAHRNVHADARLREAAARRRYRNVLQVSLCRQMFATHACRRLLSCLRDVLVLSPRPRRLIEARHASALTSLPSLCRCSDVGKLFFSRPVLRMSSAFRLRRVHSLQSGLFRTTTLLFGSRDATMLVAPSNQIGELLHQLSSLLWWYHATIWLRDATSARLHPARFCWSHCAAGCEVLCGSCLVA